MNSGLFIMEPLNPLFLEMREFCGIVGAVSKKGKDVSELLYKSLFTLQHRGQESAGIVTFGESGFNTHRGFGQVKDVFSKDILKELTGHIGIGHTRYSTFGDYRNVNNIQPLFVSSREGFMAVAHNGTLTNYDELRAELEENGYVFHSSTDSEIFLYLFLISEGNNPEEKFKEIMKKVKGAYSLLFLINDRLYFLRDPWGFRPLVFGESEDYFVVASETAALKQAGINVYEEVQPGDVGIYEGHNLEIFNVGKVLKKEQCVFELIYFSRPDSIIFGENVYRFRKECGERLAMREKREIDIVMPVPDSGIPASVGYSKALGKPLEFGLMRSHFTGRSFIEPSERDKKVRMKLIPIQEALYGMRIALIDDSLVRGTTSREIVKLLRENGAKEVHLRFASPPIVAPCFFGIDIPTVEELMASSVKLRDLEEVLDADSVQYLPLKVLKDILGQRSEEFCFSCFSGLYNPETVGEGILSRFKGYHPRILDEV